MVTAPSSACPPGCPTSNSSSASPAPPRFQLHHPGGDQRDWRPLGALVRKPVAVLLHRPEREQLPAAVLPGSGTLSYHRPQFGGGGRDVAADARVCCQASWWASVTAIKLNIGLAAGRLSDVIHERPSPLGRGCPAGHRWKWFRTSISRRAGRGCPSRQGRGPG